MKFRVALFYDQYTRDFSQMRKIKTELEALGATCGIFPSVGMLEHAIIFRPDAIVIGNPDLYHGEYAALLADQVAVFSIPTEQSIFNPRIFAERIFEGHNKNNTSFEPPNVAMVSKFFLWSEYHKNALQSAGIPESQLCVSGNPRLMVSAGSREARCVGVPLESQFSQSLPYDLWALDGIDTGYGSMIDYWNVSLNVLDRQLASIRALSKAGYKLIVRPRLSDMSTDYSFLGADVEIDRRPDPSYLLNKCETIVTGQSTIGLEAYLYGAKVITVLGMIKQSLLTDSMKSDLLFQHPLRPASTDELLGMVASDVSTAESKAFSEKVRFLLGGGTANPEKIIANEIARVVRDRSRDHRDPVPSETRARIVKKYKGIRGVQIKNKDNALGALISLPIIARRALRSRFSV